MFCLIKSSAPHSSDLCGCETEKKTKRVKKALRKRKKTDLSVHKKKRSSTHNMNYSEKTKKQILPKNSNVQRKNCFVLIDLKFKCVVQFQHWNRFAMIANGIGIRASELKEVEHTLCHILKSICLKWRWEITMNQSREEKSLSDGKRSATQTHMYTEWSIFYPLFDMIRLRVLR